MTRKPMKNRRSNITCHVSWTSRSGPDTKLIVTYGIEDNKVKEAFCSGFRADSDICSLANDGCIMMSLLLQHGVDIMSVANACGENRMEKESSGPPASLLGAIAREGAFVEKILQQGGELNISSVKKQEV